MTETVVRGRVGPYFETLIGLIRKAECTAAGDESLALDEAFERISRAAHAAHDRDNKILFFGNGGSAGVASHLAIDFSKNGGLRAATLSDGAALTALGNDFGYENVSAKQIEWHARAGDLAVAISASGRSPNILRGVGTARACGCSVVTFSGFDEDNDLRRAGDINIYVRSHEYGFVEVAHLALCHAILDLDMGWTQGAERQPRLRRVGE